MHHRFGLVVVTFISIVLFGAACSGTSEDSPPTQPTSENQQESSIPAKLTLVPNAPEDNESASTFIPPQTLGPGEGTLLLNVTMPYGYKFNDLAPFSAKISSTGRSVHIDDIWADYEQLEPEMPLEIPLQLSEGESIVTLDLSIYWCEAIKETLCFVDTRLINATISVDSGSTATTADVDVNLVPPPSFD